MNPYQGKTIIYILGSSHSGSTLLAALLGAQQGITCLGEVNVFSAESKQIKPLDARLCSCRQGNWRQCGFWQSVEQGLQKTYNKSLADLDLSSSLDDPFRQDNAAFWSVVFDLVGDGLLIDSSKTIENYVRLHQMGFRIVPIYLSRSPHGVVYSEIKKGKNWLRETFGYLHYHIRARIALRGQKHLPVQYTDLALRPEQTLKKILSLLRPEHSSIEMNWKIKQQHFLRGNGMILKNNIAITPDETWKSQLSLLQKIVIYGITLPLKFDRHWLYILYLQFHKKVKKFRNFLGVCGMCSTIVGYCC